MYGPSLSQSPVREQGYLGRPMQDWGHAVLSQHRGHTVQYGAANSCSGAGWLGRAPAMLVMGGRDDVIVDVQVLKRPRRASAAPWPLRDAR